MKDKTTQIATTEAESDLINVKQVAKMLSMSVRSVWRKVSQEEFFKPLRMNRIVRWSRRQVQDWLDAGCPTIKTNN